MQAAGTIPRGGLSLEDLGTVFERPGPFATVYLGTDPHVENDQPLPIGLDAETAQVGTDGSPTRVPLRDALVRGAWATGAAVRVVPHAGPVTDGVGAVLRWAD